MRKTLLLRGVLRDNFALPMKLLMYFQNDLVDSIGIDPEKIVLPGYLSGFTRELREKHRSLFLNHYSEPEFLLSGNFLKQRSEPQLKIDEILHSDLLIHSLPFHSGSDVHKQHPDLCF
jgi:hypothetical protein